MKNWKYGDVRKLTDNIRSYCDRHNIIVGVDQRKLPRESVVYYVFYGVGFDTIRNPYMIAINMDEIPSVDGAANRVIDYIDRELLHNSYAAGFDTIGCVDFVLSYNGKHPVIKNVIFNDPATIVFWEDGSKSVVKARDGEEYDPEKGLAMAISRKVLGNKGSYYNEFEKWLSEYNGRPHDEPHPDDIGSKGKEN